MSANGKIISIGNQSELLRLRHAVLQSAGFHVHTTESEHDAVERIRAGECGVLVMCYSLPVDIRRRIADAFRRFCPNRRIVAIANKEVRGPYFGDVVVYGIDGPEALIDAVRN